mgnify:CR=1 FL=1
MSFISACLTGGARCRGVANCVSDLKKAVPGATVLDALVVSGGNAQNAQSDVSAWLKRLGLVK